MSDRIGYLLFAALFVIGIAVADMNWPQHMGPQNVLVDHILAIVR
jgi:hypothetical protein